MSSGNVVSMKRPNILLITADDLNYDSLGVTGCRVEGISPHIDLLASEGMHFEHAHVSIAVCQPSRSVLMTGRYPHRNGALGFEPIHPNIPTLQEQLRQGGYLNGIIGKNAHLAPKEKFCWDSYIHTMNEENGYGRDPLKYYHLSRAFIAEAQALGKPFFLMANSHDPHRPFAGSEDERSEFGRNIDVSRRYRPEEVSVPGFLPDIPQVREEVSQYYSSAHRCDETVGEILRALHESGLDDDTLVMFLSDNGMAFPFAKTNCYLNSTRTPWIVRWPGRVNPGTVDREHLISGVDFMPTILEAAGLPQITGMDGKSFLPLFSGQQQEGREQVFTVFNKTAANRGYPMRCLQSVRFGYIFNAWSDGQTVFRNESQRGLTFKAMQAAAENDVTIARRVRLFEYRVSEEFYDFQQDPCALRNMIHEPEYQSEIDRMKKQLLEVMYSTNDPVADAFYRHSFQG